MIDATKKTTEAPSITDEQRKSSVGYWRMFLGVKSRATFEGPILDATARYMLGMDARLTAAEARIAELEKPDPLAEEMAAALEDARNWLSEWASAEPYLTRIENALAAYQEKRKS